MFQRILMVLVLLLVLVNGFIIPILLVFWLRRIEKMVRDGSARDTDQSLTRAASAGVQEN